jgi:hypothetical protein
MNTPRPVTLSEQSGESPMTTLAHETVLCNEELAAIAQPEAIVPNPPFVSDDSVREENPFRVEGATEGEQAKLDDYAASEARVVELAELTLDPRDALRKYSRLGAEVIKLARKRKASLAKGSWNGQKDFAKVCSDLETLVKMRVAVKDVFMQGYARTFLFVEAMKPIVPNVDKLSYHVVANKFLISLDFDPIELTGTIKAKWLTWVRLAVERQLSDDPYTMAELDASIKEHKARLETEKKGKLTDEQQLAKEQKEAESKIRRERKAAQSAVATSLDKAIVDGHADTKDVVEIVNAVLADHKMTLPSKLAGFDPANCTVADCKVLVQAMAGHGKVAEMKALHAQLDVMLKIIANASLPQANVA